MLNLIKKHLFTLVLVAGLGLYIYVAGTTGSCAACSAVTGLVGLNRASAEAVAARAQPEPQQPLAAGDRIPAAGLRDAEGRAVDLRSEVQGQPTILIFYRGGWCPFCSEHLSDLNRILPELAQLDIRLLTISPDRPEILRDKPALGGLPYELLSDSPMRTSRAFGIAFKVPDELVATYKREYGIDIEADSGETHHLLPHPSVFIVDSGGIIRFTHVNPDYKQRMEPVEILAAAKSLLGAPRGN